MNNNSKVTWLTVTRISKTLKIYLWLYGIAIGILGIYVLLSALLLLTGQSVSFLSIFSKIISCLVPLALFYGISHKKSWTPTVISILSAFGFLSILFVMTGALAPSFHYELAKSIYYLILPLAGFWQLFTLYLFNTKEVIAYFKTSGITVF
jgi:hypothetical protein